MTPEQKEEVDRLVNENLIGQSSNIVTCKCGVSMELIEGKVDFN